MNQETQDNPLHPDELLYRFSARESRPVVKGGEFTIPVLVAAAQVDPAKITVDQFPGQPVGGFGLSSQLSLKIPGASVGIHHFPPAAEPRLVLSDEEPDEEVEDTGRIEPMIPNHLPFRFRPDPLPPYLRPWKMTLRDLDLALDEEEEEGDDERKERPSTIFRPDERIPFTPMAFPFTAVGRVMNASGWGGSGVMVGPRHMLTASHVIDWDAWDAGLAPTFTPALFGTSAPFGTAFAIEIYARRRVRGSIGAEDGKQDYAVAVLSATIGFNTGFLGARNYHPRRFDGRPVWNHVGYPGDLGSSVPTFQEGISFRTSGRRPRRGRRLRHQGDIFAGQSGGPFFAFFEGEPVCIAVQSSQARRNNRASTGSWMIDLIERARADFP